MCVCVCVSLFSFSFLSLSLSFSLVTWWWTNLVLHVLPKKIFIVQHRHTIDKDPVYGYIAEQNLLLERLEVSKKARSIRQKDR